jgi:hypothetical protein
MGIETGTFDGAQLLSKPKNAGMTDPPSRKRDCCVKGAVSFIRLSTLQMLIELFMDALFHAGRFLDN